MVLMETRVLLAHGDPLERERLRRVLAACPSLTECRDMDEAERALRARPCDVLVMPFAIPGADAGSLCAAICRMREVSCPAVIVLLPEELSRFGDALRQCGVARLLASPARGEELLRDRGPDPLGQASAGLGQ